MKKTMRHRLLFIFLLFIFFQSPAARILLTQKQHKQHKHKQHKHKHKQQIH